MSTHLFIHNRIPKLGNINYGVHAFDQFSKQINYL